jgi:phospholipid transport system substrate-binding protein
MKALQSAVVLLFSLFIAFSAKAGEPTEVLKSTVDQLISAVSDKSKDDNELRESISRIVHQAVDFEVVAMRIIAKPWKNATDTQKQEFKTLFAEIMVDTYFDLLKNYSNESVTFDNEQVKNDKYAIVDTTVVSGDKKIPVRYRLVKVNGQWKIYDFVVEGVSLVSSYKSNYRTILAKEGFDGLLKSMRESKQKRNA